ncbi:SanA/YdcF family protein [Aquimarina agarilytica]|uniref:SanA/YdcF family protein n=1 Tax=Aquimarina agarilytica TaxID=1087449 RepID=UPI000287C687
MNKTNLKKISKISLIAFLLGCCCIYFANKSISNTAKKRLYSSVDHIPKNKVGLLLGTSKYVATGQLNLYYQYRIQAAATLYHASKIEYILVSGDNSTKSYNEPKKIKEDLIKKGVPENKIVLDYAGFRTLDSVVRAQKVFGENQFTVISQKFHNERALFLADHFNSNAIAFNAKGVSSRYGFKVQIREYFARVKVFIDLLFNVKPKFLGDKITIG